MKRIAFFPFFIMMLVCVSCGKIELEEPAPDKPGISVGGDEKPDDGNLPDGVISVSALAGVDDGTDVVVAGYIVGYVPANHSLKTMVPGAEAAVASNIVISDVPRPKDYTQCAAVQLTKDTDPRDYLNLAENPGNLGAYIYVAGVKAKYFAAPGLKSVYDFSIVEPPVPGDPDEPEPEQPVGPSAPYPVLVGGGEAEVFEGC